jgi:hypothetical protein
MVLVIGTSMEQRHRQFVGRRSEVEALNGLIDAPGPSIALVHGIAGVGWCAVGLLTKQGWPGGRSPAFNGSLQPFLSAPRHRESPRSTANTCGGAAN